MTNSDINKIHNLVLEQQYRNIETMQPTANMLKVDNQKRSPTLSTPVWDGLVNPSKGNLLNSFSVDEEQLNTTDKLKKLIQQEIDVAPKKMTYAKRVLKKLLDQIDSL
jgi:hypothetical protein